MGIAFEALGFHVLHILLPAIIIVNIFNLAVNSIYSEKERRGLIHERDARPSSATTQNPVSGD